MLIRKLLVFFVLCLNINLAGAQLKKIDTAAYKSKPIMVTALKYEEDHLETPMATSIIDPTISLNNRSIGAEDALNLAPGVFAQSRAGGADIRLTIRGFGARGAGDRSNSGTSRGVKILIDGMPETEPDGRTAFDNININSFNKIEILRSNASALWGNASGGVVNFSTAPLFSSPYSEITAKSGEWGFASYMFRAGAPLGSGNIYSTANYSKFDGWRNHSSSEKSDVNLTLKSAIGTKGLLGVYAIGSHNRFDIPGPLTQAQYDSCPYQANAKYLSQKKDATTKILDLALHMSKILIYTAH